jgi:hypothetical protein
METVFIILNIGSRQLAVGGVQLPTAFWLLPTTKKNGRIKRHII